MKQLKDKQIVVMGVANNRSIATAIAEEAFAHGAALGFSYLRDHDGKGKMEARVQKAIGQLNPSLLAPCDVNQDEDIRQFFEKTNHAMGTIDGLVHSIAFAPLEDIRCATIDASRQGFIQALESSCYSFIATAREASRYMQAGASMITLSYLGGERVIPGYNLMGVAKAALESAIKYLAHDLGARGIRVNGISAGPVKTLASSAVGDFGKVLKVNQLLSPLKRNITAKDVAETAVFLLGPYSSGITGELIHVDAGYHIIGHPGHETEKLADI